MQKVTNCQRITKDCVARLSTLNLTKLEKQKNPKNTKSCHINTIET